MTDPHMPRVEAGEAETMQYPVIFNGDHAEFEAEWAGKDPKTRPDWPLPSFDARDWAEAFLKTTPASGRDEGAMIGWFANALMRGFDEARARAAPAPQDTAEAMAEVERLASNLGEYAEGYSSAVQMGNLRRVEHYEKLLNNKKADLLAAVRALAYRAATAEAALASLRAEQEVPAEWQDISTAPKDGTTLLLACADWPHSTILGKSVPIKVGGWGRGWEVFGASWQPTHWRPLPEPPRISAQKDRADG